LLKLNNTLDLSLIISTRNRVESLKRTLDVITQIVTDSKWELVVVDNGSTDGTAEYLREFSSSSILNVTVVHETTPGLANARNAGVRAASGSILAFTDDDCLPSNDFVDQTLNVFHEDHAIGFMGGRILLHDPTDQPITIKESTEREIIEPGQFIEAGLIHGANFACRRSAVLDSGGFDPFFGAGSHYAVEDIDMAARISAQGWRGVYDPRPVVRHNHGRKTIADAESLEHIYAKGRGAYYVKCLIQKQWSLLALKQWYWASRRKPLASLSRELRGGVSFLLRSCWDRGRRFRELNLESNAN
jgi:GT2 family glycosyltransferase